MATWFLQGELAYWDATEGQWMRLGDDDLILLGDIDATGGARAVKLKDNTADAFQIKDGANEILGIDTTDGSELITLGYALAAITMAGDITMPDGGIIGTATQNIKFDDTASAIDITSADADVGTRFYSGANPMMTVKRLSAANPTLTKIEYPSGMYIYQGATQMMVLSTVIYNKVYTHFENGAMFDVAKAAYFRDVAIHIASLDDGHLDLTADISVDVNAPLDMNTHAISGVTSLTASKRIVSGQVTCSASSDAFDVSECNSVLVDTSDGAVVLGGFAGGVAGQIVHVVITDATNDTTIEHNEGTGTQKFFMCDSTDETLDDYGGWTLVCDGTNWYDASHAKHIG